ncbi:TetR/AcrR family transcriptional regulator [Nocardia sp. CDC159]|uniref:TetR/AcrR family transcriptional regulator n=1 Tax=Nocardia pulmonis TaxID=2951408 RepID=A0A9X2ECN2_9NOCA|nr:MULTISPECIES: TetR/AcrR family transcriptional regulator [Nocardia]MCM6778307.1 TetR/AcrR family transcriptional regulator [Nocardia pulmonis]MCM6791297.1 TetR/AcrR family transcriptional regulator [Nocardia sp. CDC159]
MARTVDPQRVAERRTAIIRAATKLFATHGYERTSVAQIAKAAGLSSAAVFYYFQDKPALFRAAAELSLPEHAELISRHVGRTDCLAGILAIAEGLTAEVRDPTTPGFMIELLRRMEHDPELTAAIASDSHRSAEALTILLRRGAERGEFDSGFPPEEVARWILAIVDATFLNADPARPHDPRPLVRATVSRLLRPIEPEVR